MDEYKIIIENLERLRKNYGLEYNDVDHLASLKTGTYEKAIDGKQVLDVTDLIAITKIYIPDPSKIFNPKMRMPLFKNLPPTIKKIATERVGKKEKTIEKKDFIQYCILVVNKHFKVGDEFINSQIKGYLNDELKNVFKSKSIEWDKSIIAEYIFDTKTTRPAKTKPENVYKLSKAIPQGMVKKAKEVVGEDWLENKDEKTESI